MYLLRIGVIRKKYLGFFGTLKKWNVLINQEFW